MCGECLRKLSPAERMARFEAARTLRALDELNIRFENQAGQHADIAKLARSIENLARVLKLPAEEIDDIAGMVKNFITELRRRMRDETDDGEEWKDR